MVSAPGTTIDVCNIVICRKKKTFTNKVANGKPFVELTPEDSPLVFVLEIVEEQFLIFYRSDVRDFQSNFKIAFYISIL